MSRVAAVEAGTMRQRVTAARVGRLATVTSDHRPHVVPCCFALDGDTVYSAVDAKPKSTLALQRLANMRSNPAVSLLVDRYEDDWSALWWVRVDGWGREVATPAEREAALDLLARKYAQYAETTPPGPVVAIDVTGWRAWP